MELWRNSGNLEAESTTFYGERPPLTLKDSAVNKRLFAISVIFAVLLAAYTLRPRSERPADLPRIETPEPTAVEKDALSLAERAPTTEFYAPAPVYGTLISGTARYLDSGAPVPDVIVHAYDEHADSFHEVTTNERGEYALVDLNPGERGVDISLSTRTDVEGHHAAFVHPMKRLYPGDQWTRFDIEVSRNAGMVTGRVLGKTTNYSPELVRNNIEELMSDHSTPEYERALKSVLAEVNDPISGVRVILTSHGNPRPEPSEAVTNASGEFLFDDLAPGGYVVYVAVEDRVVQTVGEPGRREFTIAHGEVITGLDLFVEPNPVALSGHVLDERGRGIAGAKVAALPYLSDVEGSKETRKAIETTTAEDGSFQFAGLRAGDFNDAMAYLYSGMALHEGAYFILAQAEGYASERIIVPVLHRKSIDFSLAFVDAAKSSSRRQELADVLLTPIRQPERNFGDSTMSEVDIILQAESVVAGYIVDTKGQRVTESTIRLVPEKLPERRIAFESYPPEFEFSECGEGGSFQFVGVPAGTYQFEVFTESGGQQTAHNSPFRVTNSAVYEDIAVVVESPLDRGDITGTVIDGVKRQPLTEFKVHVESVESPSEPSPRYGNLTVDKEQSRFRLEGASMGVITLNVEAEGFATEHIQTRLEGGAAVELNIELQPEAVLRGRITKNGQLTRDHSHILIRDVPIAYQQADEQGLYTLKALKPGTYLAEYQLNMAGEDLGGTWATERRWVQVESGRETFVDVDFGGACSIEGSYSGPDGVPWTVEVYDESMPGEIKLCAGASGFRNLGRYEINGLQPGAYTVTGKAGTADATVAEVTHQVVLADGERLTLDFDL